jgi:hypothetical protein
MSTIRDKNGKVIYYTTEHSRFINKSLELFKRHENSTACPYCSYTGCIWLSEKYGRLGHWLWAYQYIKSEFFKLYGYRAIIKRLTALDYSKIEDVEVDGIDMRDAPDFCDAYIASATYKGRAMTEAELDELNQDRDFVYSAVENHLY